MSQMNFSQRLMRFMLGIGIGTALAFFFFQDRGCSKWLPSAKVREFLAEPGLMGDDRTRCLIRCEALQMSEIVELLDEGNINFGASDVRLGEGVDTKFYLIENSSLSAEFVVTDSVTTVRRVVQKTLGQNHSGDLPEACDCD
ncbi:MAG: hypothetical protein P8M07_09195 [Flavobacteriales bacterium]|nr:hypothetical protein [Flavobacteriales bacterium]